MHSFALSSSLLDARGALAFAVRALPNVDAVLAGEPPRSPVVPSFARLAGRSGVSLEVDGAGRLAGDEDVRVVLGDLGEVDDADLAVLGEAVVALAALVAAAGSF